MAQRLKIEIYNEKQTHLKFSSIFNLNMLSIILDVNYLQESQKVLPRCYHKKMKNEKPKIGSNRCGTDRFHVHKVKFKPHKVKLNSPEVRFSACEVRLIPSKVRCELMNWHSSKLIRKVIFPKSIQFVHMKNIKLTKSSL